ncbi:MAG: SPFH/Band 7/PHB domain protein [Spirochaetales bacterium]|nr:SPFH/Band 7/PHB domain protein [Spirochaetales bacterium]
MELFLIVTGSIFLIILFFSGIRIVRPINRGVVETLGKYTGFARPGFHWIIPVIQRMIQVNITERMVDIEPQEIITQNRLNAKVDLVIYYKVREDEESVKKSLYNVHNFSQQIVMLAKTSARNVIGELIFEDVNSKRHELNGKLQLVLDKESDDWGVQVVRVELKEILPPQDVQETMNNVIKAENKKTAAMDFASATEIEADGERRAAIKVAEGRKQAAILEAEGKSQAFKMINESFVGNAQLLRQLDVTENSLKDNLKIVFTENGISPQILIGDIPIKSKMRK